MIKKRSSIRIVMWNKLTARVTNTFSVKASAIWYIPRLPISFSDKSISVILELFWNRKKSNKISGLKTVTKARLTEDKGEVDRGQRRGWQRTKAKLTEDKGKVDRWQRRVWQRTRPGWQRTKARLTEDKGEVDRGQRRGWQRICKRTFFQVCKMSGYINTLVYFQARSNP